MHAPNGVTTVLFDLDGTLHYNFPSAEHAFFDFAMRLGAVDSAELRRSTIRWSHGYWAQSRELRVDLDRFEGEDEAFWTNYARRRLEMFTCNTAQAAVLAGEVHRCMVEEYKPQDKVPEGAHETLQALKEAGFVLGVVSNRSEAYHEYLARIGMQGYFKCAIAAGEVASWKPEPQIFYHALDVMRASAEKTVYVGDNYYADVIGARRAGIQPVLLDPEGIFPDAGCPVIGSFADLLNIL